MRSILLLFIPLFLLLGCRISESAIAGKYIDRERDDTLHMMADKTYEFEERLKNGEHGWNTGNWQMDKRTISFFNTKPLPLVGFTLRITKTGITAYPLQLNFSIDQSEKTVQFTDVRISGNMLEGNSSDVSIVSNKIIVKTANFDSLQVKIGYFPFISFSKNKFDKNGVYEVMVYPAERLYELDKLSYKYRNGSLINHSGNIRYKKIVVK